MSTIEEYRRAKGLTQQELADTIGVTKAMVYRYETKGARPSRELRTKIAEVLEVNYEDLWGNVSEIESVVFIPVVDNIITASAGIGNDCGETEWNIIDKVPYPAKSLMGHSWQCANYKIITADGDSMEPIIHSGDELLFAENIDVYNGDIAIVSVNGKVFVKGVIYGKDSITLLSSNPAYPERVFDTQDYDVRILGKVLRIRPKERTAPSMI